MSIILRNKNIYVYRVKSRIQRYVYGDFFLLEKYLKLKEAIMKIIGGLPAGNVGLFKKVFIETVSYCNNDCAFCPASSKSGVKKPQHLMAEDLYLKILNELADISFAGSLAFHCNNEPLLDKRLVRLIGIARGILKNNYFYLYTNGILINPALASQLFSAGLNRIIINNYNDDHELIPSVKEMVDKASALRGELIVNYRFKNEYLENRAGENPVARMILRKPLKIICTRPLSEIVVGYDGTVPLCCADGLWKVVMGNAGDSSLQDIWFSAPFKNARESLAGGDRSCAEICKFCDALHFPAVRGI
jgi:MoaA/NifB/PqqE/SkfB family radical SAM enzyme